MAGLEKIKSQILDEAKESANVRIEDAKDAGRTDEDSGAGRRSRTGRTDPEEV